MAFSSVYDLNKCINVITENFFTNINFVFVFKQDSICNHKTSACMFIKNVANVVACIEKNTKVA